MSSDDPRAWFTLLRPLGILLLVVGGVSIAFVVLGAMLVRREPTPCTPSFWYYPHLAALGLVLLSGDYLGRRYADWE